MYRLTAGPRLYTLPNITLNQGPRLTSLLMQRDFFSLGPRNLVTARVAAASAVRAALHGPQQQSNGVATQTMVHVSRCLPEADTLLHYMYAYCEVRYCRVVLGNHTGAGKNMPRQQHVEHSSTWCQCFLKQSKNAKAAELFTFMPPLSSTTTSTSAPPGPFWYGSAAAPRLLDLDLRLLLLLYSK